MSHLSSTASAAGLLYLQPGPLDGPEIPALGVYFDRQFYSIPLHSSLERSRYWEVISLNFKIYILGGEYHNDQGITTSEVYSFNLLTRTWIRCADMLRRRTAFGVGILDGKIYVFGGAVDGIPILDSEIYDPAVNAWPRIADMMELRVNSHVIAIDKLLVVCGGLLLPWGVRHHTDTASDTDSLNSDSDEDSDSADSNQDNLQSRVWAYHPEENQWIPLNHVEGEEPIFEDDVFLVKGHCYRFTASHGGGIETYDLRRKSWSFVHRIGGWTHGQNHLEKNELPHDLDLGLNHGQALMIDGELLTVGHLSNDSAGGLAHLLRANGFGEDAVLQLEVLKSFPAEFEDHCTALFPLDV